MTESDIVSAVMETVTSWEGVTSTSLSPDQVALEVDTFRVRMMDELDKTSLFRRPYAGFTQTIPSLVVDRSTDRKTLSVTIPRLVRRRDGELAYLYIGGADKKSQYRVATSDDVQNMEHDHFLGKKAIAHYSEGVITIHGAAPNTVRIVGVFEDPGALAIYDGVYDEDTSQYPFPAGMVDQLIGKTIESYLRTLYRVPVQSNTQSDLIANALIANAGLKRK